MTTIAQARRAMAGRFREAGFDSPDLDARILTGHALGLGHAALASEAARVLTTDEMRTLDGLAARRLGGEPVARITGVKEFWGLPLRITAATLVPRPYTETVVEAALAAIDNGGERSRPLRIADLGTGSGALLLALLSELPNAVGTATDIVPAALDAARDNARRLKFDARATFVACHYGAALAGVFGLVVVNPPYIPSRDIAALPKEVLRDPLTALDGGSDGLDGYRALANDARRLIVPGGYIVVELGIGQAADVSNLFDAAGLEIMPARADLSGTARALTARVATKPP
jgi:release factor glutamine methyltransferase